jgi:type III pantothenate kinase
VDGILELLLTEMADVQTVVATGGLAPLIGTASKYIKRVDEHLTLDGLRIIWERNVPRPVRESGPAKAQRPATESSAKLHSKTRLPR